MIPVEFTMALKTDPQLHGRTWQARHGVVKDQRAKVASWLTASVPWQAKQELRARLGLGQAVAVTLTRHYRATPCDPDNLGKALKHVRDEITAWLGLKDDADPRLRWLYRQAKGGGVTVRLEAAEAEEDAA